MTDPDRAQRIAALNDEFRHNVICLTLAGRLTLAGQLGKLLVTPGIRALDTVDKLAVIKHTGSFNRFDADNDLYGEHDFGAFDHQCEHYFWKIDYYAGGGDFSAGSEDPADASKTTRVLTIMRADEY